jgi:hypothetical protein
MEHRPDLRKQAGSQVLGDKVIPNRLSDQVEP